MPGGADWEREIGQKLRACDIFILLVSRHSLSSDYVVDKEIAIIRERQAKGEDVHFYPLVLTPTPKIALDRVRDKNLRPRDGKPFSDYSLNERYRHMSDAADEIAEIAVEIARRKGAVTRPVARFVAAAIVISERVDDSECDNGRAGTFVSTPAEEPTKQELQITDPASLGFWLAGQNRELAVAIAARTASRVSPLVVRAFQGLLSSDLERKVGQLTSAVFRAGALARVVAKYPERAGDFRKAAGEAMRVALEVAQNAAHAAAALGAMKAAVASVNATFADASANAANAANAALDATVGVSATAVAWEEIQADVIASREKKAGTLVDLPLWARGAPRWAEIAWAELRELLPEGEDWDVWIDWYEERLRGGSRGEEYELSSAACRWELWNKGPAAANKWICEHLAGLGQVGRAAAPEISDAQALKAWLNGQSRDVAVAVAVRAALRVSPLSARLVREATATKELPALAGAIFRAVALGLTSVRYPRAMRMLAGLAEAAGAAQAAADAGILGPSDTLGAWGYAAIAAGDFAYAAEATNIAFCVEAAVAAVRAFVASFGKADVSVDTHTADATAWWHIRADIALVQGSGPIELLNLPLWIGHEPRWAVYALDTLEAALPDAQDWDVWIDWYEVPPARRIARQVDELAFASVPLDACGQGSRGGERVDQGALAERNRKPAEQPRFQSPLPDIDAPFAYGWNTKLRVEVVAGAQNLPFYSFFSSEEDHQKTLEACRGRSSNGC